MPKILSPSFNRLSFGLVSANTSTPVVFDAATAFSAVSVTNTSFVHTPVGVPTCVVFSMGSFGVGDPSTLTYGGQNMTLVTGVATGVDNLSMAYLANPPSGPQTVFIDWGVSTSGTAGGIISVTGSSLVTGIRASSRVSNTANGTALSLTETTSDPLDLIVMGWDQDTSGTFSLNDAVSTFRTNQTQGGIRFRMTTATGSSGSVAAALTSTNSAVWGAIGVSIQHG